tara:strand:- start:19141 stop:19431 length:291 start_codon:yes stop_codon:yes gene_type:complete
MLRATDFKGRFIVLALLVFAICTFLFYQVPLSHLSSRTPQLVQQGRTDGATSGAVLTGHAIAPKLGNETAKYVRQDPDASAWKRRTRLTTLDIEQN